MTRYLFINNIWSEFVELLAMRPIDVHEFYSTGMDCLNKTFFLVNLKFLILCHTSTLYSCFQRFRYLLDVIKLLAWFEKLIRDASYDTVFKSREHSFSNYVFSTNSILLFNILRILFAQKN